MSETLKEQGFSSTDDRAQIQTQALKSICTSELHLKRLAYETHYILVSLQKIW